MTIPGLTELGCVYRAAGRWCCLPFNHDGKHRLVCDADMGAR